MWCRALSAHDDRAQKVWQARIELRHSQMLSGCSSAEPDPADSPTTLHAARLADAMRAFETTLGERPATIWPSASPCDLTCAPHPRQAAVAIESTASRAQYPLTTIRGRIKFAAEPELVRRKSAGTYDVASSHDDLEPPSGSFLEEALFARRRTLGDAHQETLNAASSLAFQRLQVGDLDRAAVLLEEVVAGRRQRLGPSHHHTLVAIWALGMVKSDLQLLQEACSGLARAFSDTHEHSQQCSQNLAAMRLLLARDTDQ